MSDLGAEHPSFEIASADLELLEVVGSGSTADVYRARWTIPDGTKEVAVKRIDLPALNAEAAENDMLAFQREIAVLTRIQHPNLVGFLGIISTRPVSVVTEYCRGGCVFDIIHERPNLHLTWSQKHKMILDTAKAMNYLHCLKPQIIHRDLKSLNLLLTEELNTPANIPHIKLSDFGLSKIKESGPDSSWGKMTNACGTTHWMAPEVVMGTKYDEKVDVYSFSMILFEIICQEMPFDDLEPLDVGPVVAQGSRPTMAAIPPDCPEHFRNLMVACWAHHPQRRPAFTLIVELLSSAPIP